MFFIDEGSGRASSGQFGAKTGGRNSVRNIRKIVFNRDVGTDFNTFLAGNTGRRTVFAGGSPFLAIAAGNVNLLVFLTYRANLEQLARADINTGAARRAFIGINNRDAGFRVEMQCVETANFNAVAKTQAAIGTTGTSG